MSAVHDYGVSLGDSGAEGLMVLFWSLSRLDAKSLERASMDYEAPLMPCGCILLQASTEPGSWSAHTGKVKLMNAPLGHSSSMGPICPLEDWGCGGGTKDPAEGAGKETGDPGTWQGDGRDRGKSPPPSGVISLHGQQSISPGGRPQWQPHFPAVKTKAQEPGMVEAGGS